MENENFQRLSKSLRSCQSNLLERQREIAERLERPTLSLAGFGNKGRPLALFLRDVLGKEVRVYDTTAKGHQAAIEAGFQVYETKEEVDPSDAVVLSACQHQLDQMMQFPRNYVFHEEAGYFYNVPFVFNRSQDFSNWILENWNEIINFVVSQPLESTRKALESVLRFRMSLDPRELSEARRPVSGMWFDLPAEFRKRPYRCFLDVGAFDGDTLEAVTEWSLGFTKAVAVEANTDFGPKILERSHLYSEGIEVIPTAAWSKSCRLSAKEDFSGMVTVTESENGPIRAESLDDVVSASVDFMKMDIEGAEGSALAGASNLLAQNPDIAIAAYHRPEDILSLFRKVADSVESFDRYSLHVAHYSECLDDTILYFLADGGSVSQR